MGLVGLFVRLVLSGVSLRAVSRSLQIVVQAAGLSWGCPHWTTGRIWLQRLGHAKLTSPKEQADDWAWLADHSVQIGEQKCLVILGIRLCHLPPPGECLAHEDMELIALVPMHSSTRRDVEQQLEAAVSVTGVPRVIVDDHGVDLTGGVSFFRQQHAETVEIYDIKHKSACLLKARLEKEPRWQELQQRIAQTRCAIQQTELAFLVPPGPKPKSRFMNLGPLLAWGQKTLAVVEQPCAKVLDWTSVERLEEKLGWLREFRAALWEWTEWQELVDAAVEFVNRQGLYRGAADDLARSLPSALVHPSSERLADELREFVAAQSSQARPGERLPGSTEVLESCFGKFKALEKDQAKGGFTGLLLAFGALLTKTTSDVVRKSLEHSRTKDVLEWCRETLGTTVYSQRKLAFQAVHGATKPG